RRVAEEAELALIALEEIQVTGPHQHIRVGLRRMLSRNQPCVDVNSLIVFVIKRKGPDELDVRFGDLDIRHVPELLELKPVRRKTRESAVLRYQPLQVAVVQTIEHHLLMVAAQHDDVGIPLRKLDHAIDDARRVVSSVDHIAEKDDLVVSNIPGDIADELIQQGQPAVDISYYVCCHSLFAL